MPESAWGARLRRVQQLTWSERFLIGEAALLIALLRVALAVFGIRRVQGLLDAMLRASVRTMDTGAIDRERAMAISKLVDVAARYTVANTCLHRSVALWFLLGRRGLSAEVRVGVRRQDGRFEAHAWVEYAGGVVNDGGEPRYAPLAWPRLHHEA